MFFDTIALGDKYSGLTCLALMWFAPTPPERSAIMKVVYRKLFFHSLFLLDLLFTASNLIFDLSLNV